MKNQTLQNSHLAQKNLESAEFTNKKHGKPTLHSMIANHVLEVSVKLESQCVRFEEALFCSGGFESVSYLFYQALFTRWDLHHRILLYYYAEKKEMIYESVNLKGVVYEPNQNSFGLQSITTRIGLQTLARSFIKNSFPRRGGGGNSILDHTGCTPIWGLLFQLKFLNQVEEFVRNS